MNVFNYQAVKDVFVVHDIKETAKRMRQLSLITICVACIVAVIELYYRNYFTFSITIAKIFSSCLVLLLLRAGYFRVAKYFIFFQINFFLLSVAFTVGHRAGGYMYYFPLMFALPMLTNNHKKQLYEIAAYLSVTMACFCASVFWGRESSTVDHITDATYNTLFRVNCFFAAMLSALFAFSSVYFERKYALALMAEKKKVDEAMQARTRFLSTMGHELRTPLNGIIGVSGLLQKEAILPAQKTYFKVLADCSEHMLNLVNDILDFNKIEAGKFDLHPIGINLKQFLTNSALPFFSRFEEKGIALLVTVDDKLDMVVMADDMRLTQVINNLLSNALKFTIKGSVTLRATCFNTENSRVTAIIEVEDTGIGMLKEDTAKIFGSFWQIYHESSRKYAGTGLGLNITQRLLNLMGTELEVKSELDIGTTFYFTLALPLGKLSKQQLVDETDTADLSAYRILIADDNPVNMLVAKKVLLNWHANVTACKSGREVLDAMTVNHRYNIVLLDLEMPDIDGYTAAAQIKQLYPGIPMLAFTAALVDKDLLNKLLSIGFSGCILKPFYPKQLLAKIREYATEL